MGKKSTFERAHQRQVRHTREQRSRRSATVKATRRGDVDSGRLIQRTARARTLASGEKRTMLIEQFAQACRLPATCEDLCVLLHQVGGEQARGDLPHKRTRDGVEEESVLDAIVDAFLRLEHQAATTMGYDDDDGVEGEPLTLLEDVVRDECGARVICALISAVEGLKCETKKALVLESVMKLFEENTTLYEHFVACKVLSSLVQHGNCATQMRALQVLRKQAVTGEQLLALLRNRHSSVTLQHLLEHLPVETVKWLGSMLLGMESSDKTQKCGETCTDNDGDGHYRNERGCPDKLVSLILDPVASPVIRALFVRSTTRASLFKCIGVVTLLENRRGCRFLQETLSHESQNWTAEEALAVLDLMMVSCEEKLVDMCTSGDANFVVQSIIRLVLCTGKAATQEVHFKRILKILRPHLSFLVTHSIGVHVVVALVTTALSFSTEIMSEEVGTALVTRSNVAELLCDKHGSLVVRKLLTLCTNKESKVGQLLSSTIEQDITSWMYDAIGNLTVQEYIKVSGGENLARRLAKADELLSMCQHAYASHVVGCLFDHVGASTHVSLCNALRPHVLGLSKHVNGRFVVEKAICASREIRDVVLCHFLNLAYVRGTQHLLCTLVTNLDQRGKKQVIDTVVTGLSELARQQCTSIVMQKLMQSDATLLQAVRKELLQKPLLRNNLAQDFFGKFVVQISETAEK